MTIPLESERWKTLHHAYGSASDIPAMLAVLQDETKKEKSIDLFDELGSKLLHQYDVDTASYAAVPHLVDAAERSDNPVRKLRIVEIAYSIECYRHRPSCPALPDDVALGYHKSINALFDVLQTLLSDQWEEEDFASILAGLAVTRGHTKLGAAISELSDEAECPECGAQIVTPGRDWFVED